MMEKRPQTGTDPFRSKMANNGLMNNRRKNIRKKKKGKWGLSTSRQAVAQSRVS